MPIWPCKGIASPRTTSRGIVKEEGLEAIAIGTPAKIAKLIAW